MGDPGHFATVVTGRGGGLRASIASQDTNLQRGRDTTMGSAWHEDSALNHPAARWGGLLALVLVAGCGGDREKAATAGEGSVAAVDTAAAPAPAPTDTAIPGGAAADTAAVVHRDTTSQPAPSGATQASKPATPAPKPPPKAAAPKPAAEKPATPKPTTATPPQDTTTVAQPAQQPAPAAQDSPPPAQGGDQPLRDAYHQAPRDTVDQVTYNGWKQFNLNCARCHGEDVTGTTIAPHLILSLKPDGPINTKELFVQTVCAGRPEKGMPSWCALGMDPAKINEIYTYVKGRSDGKLAAGRPARKEGS
jgi:hypothetical protein